MDPARRDEVLERYREHSARFETIAARRAAAAPPAEGRAGQARNERSAANGPTAREIDVLQLVSEGLGNREIAERLSLSEETVKSHVRHVLAKLKARSRAHAVALGFRGSLLR